MHYPSDHKRRTRKSGRLAWTLLQYLHKLKGRDSPPRRPISAHDEMPVNQSGEQKMKGRGYCLISPCRDEAEYMRATLDSVLKQTIPPTQWVIVNDGSTDRSAAILKDYASRYDFIKVIHRGDRGRRSLGVGVINSFYEGLATIELTDFNYICKLDLDVELPPDYFETLIQRMEAQPRLGTCSGKPYFRLRGKPIREKCSDEMSVGMTKFYRRECFEEIGGFVRSLMWDGIDCHRCRQLGWMACSYDDQELRFIHLRPMGSSDRSLLRGRMRHGVGQHFMGTGPMFLAASALSRLPYPPLVLGSLAMIWGYGLSLLAHKQRYGDPEFRRFLRQYQWSCLLRGKARTVRLLDAKRARIWDARKNRLDEKK